MADQTWVRQVIDPADANVRRTTTALRGRTDYIKRRLDAAEFGQAVFARDVTLDPDLLEGQPVYWDEDAQRFAAARAAAETDAETGALVASPSSDCLGVLYAKEFSTKGHVLLFGYAPLDLVNSVGADAPAGRYYLSGTDPGKLTRQRPGLGVPVLFCDGAGNVFVQPALKEFAEDHVHYSVALACKPAGHTTQPEPGGTHAITSPNVALRGWLPAGHSSFGGRAPARAVFGYNLAAHPELQRIWPPVPVDAAVVTWDKGNGLAGGADVPLGKDGLVILDRHGIWWTSDCYGDVPWPTATNTSASSETSEPSSSSGTGAECPRWERMRLTVAYARMGFATDKSVVTRLRPFEGSPIRFVDCDGNAGDTGDLFAKFETDFVVDDNDADGNLALKELVAGKFKRGYVVQGVRSANDNLTIAGTRTKTIDEVAYAQGLLTLAVNLDPAARDLPVSLVRLDDVKERHYEDVMYLGFPASTESSIRAKLKVPGAGLPANPKVKLRAQVLGRAAGTLPDLDVTYRVLPRPGASPEALPTSDTALAFSSSGAVGADEYVEAESDPVTVAAGDTILVTVARATGDGYAGEVGLLDLIGVLYSGG